MLCGAVDSSWSFRKYSVVFVGVESAPRGVDADDGGHDMISRGMVDFIALGLRKVETLVVRRDKQLHWHAVLFAPDSCNVFCMCSCYCRVSFVVVVWQSSFGVEGDTEILAWHAVTAMLLD